jgi:hypothetical protein
MLAKPKRDCMSYRRLVGRDHAALHARIVVEVDQTPTEPTKPKAHDEGEDSLV